MDKIYDPLKLEDEIARVLHIDKQNMDFLKRLNRIYRSKAVVDCWNTNMTTFPDTSNDARLADNLKIIKDNREMYERLRTVTAKVKTRFQAPHLKNYLKNKKKTRKSIIRMMRSTHPKCYFKFQIAETGHSLGEIIIELYVNIVPKTCKNFLSFCKGTHGLCYEKTPFHRIIDGYLCQGGDVTNYNGSGGTSIYGDYFEDENFQLKHSEPGTLSMCNSGPNTNTSKFNLTLKKLEILDGKNVVFGKVIRGLQYLYRIGSLFGTKTGKPRSTIIISKCGFF